MKTQTTMRRAAWAVLAAASGTAAIAASSSSMSGGAAVADPLERPALAQRKPERAVLLGAALAGKRVVAVGERGLVALSDDDGATWRQARRVPVSVTLTVVKFASASEGWAAGHGGVVLRTADGGETWVRQLDGVQAARLALQRAEALLRDSADAPPGTGTAPPGKGAARRGPSRADALRLVADAQRMVSDGADKPIFDLDVDDGRVVAAGAYGLLMASLDGGAHWESWIDRADNPKALHLYSVRSHGGALRLAGEQGILLDSAVSGARFTRTATPYGGSWFTLAPQGGGVLMAGLRGTAYRYGGGTGISDVGIAGRGGGVPAWTRLEGLPPMSVTTSAAADDGCTLLANQAGQVFAVDAGGTGVTLLALAPMPAVTSLARAANGAWLALTMQGVFRLGRLEQACTSHQQRKAAEHHE
ncbi:MAG: hypothetical protein V4724_06965 [Pseudomonadota bacterium]